LVCAEHRDQVIDRARGVSDRVQVANGCSMPRSGDSLQGIGDAGILLGKYSPQV
jgi:hypothetical protein